MIFKPKFTPVFFTGSICLTLAACGGDDGRNGTDGADGADALDSLINQTLLLSGDSSCFNGGTRFDSGLDTDEDGILDTDEITDTEYLCNAASLNTSRNFNRIASFPVCSQIDAACDDDTTTAAEIVAVSTDGMTLVYSDSPREVIGFVDITDPSTPVADGTFALAGEPTSVTVMGDNALVGVNTSADFILTSGTLDVIDIPSQTAVTSIDVGGQPDSIAASPDGNYIAVVIENERDEDLGDGAPPQLPAGTLVIVDSSDADPTNWTTSTLDLTGIADLFPTDPEPEFVDINEDNIAVVTLQENNHIILVDLASGEITNHFSAGTVDLTQIDTVEEDPAVISLDGSDSDIPREPDGVAWINTRYLATADEGDLDGGSRGFTVFNTDGDIVYSSGNMLDHLAVRFGHYPDARSENKGNEPENIEMGVFGDNRYLFVNSERSSLVFVFDVADPTKPVYKQTLPAALGPEGGLAIPSRNLLVVASEEDDRSSIFRSVVNIYNYTNGSANYPTLMSTDRVDGTPIPWGAISGLAADPKDSGVLWAVLDSFYAESRIFKIDISSQPAVIVEEIYLNDSDDAIKGMTIDADFVAAERDALVNADDTVNLDLEGIDVITDSNGNLESFVVASEGGGNAGSVSKPNFLAVVELDGTISEVIELDPAINAGQRSNGFEGVAIYNDDVYVAFQRAWTGLGDTDGTDARIGHYDPDTDNWEFFIYPLDASTTPNAGDWIGLSELTSLGGGEFLVLERDKQGGPDARIKRLYTFDLTGLNDGDPIVKTLVRDLLDDLSAPGGLINEKQEGVAVVDGDVWIVNDNDGVDDHSGETQLINLGNILP